MIKEVHLERQDELLKFGATNTLGAAATYPCGYSATYADGNALDLGKTDLEGMSVIFHVDTAVVGATSITCKVLVTDTPATSNSWKEIAVSPAIPVANLTEAKEFAVAIPRGHEAGRYMKAAVTVTGTATAGKVSAYVDCFIGK